MTFSIRQQTVTVKRDDIIDALHQGLKKHKIAKSQNLLVSIFKPSYKE